MFFSPDGAGDEEEKKPVAVIELPYYDTLRTVLEPFTAVSSEADADRTFLSAEIIKAIEEHHGVPQGAQQGKAVDWVKPEDFVRAMTYLGFKAVNTGGLGLQWLMKNK